MFDQDKFQGEPRNLNKIQIQKTSFSYTLLYGFWIELTPFHIRHKRNVFPHQSNGWPHDFATAISKRISAGIFHTEIDVLPRANAASYGFEGEPCFCCSDHKEDI